jgi:pyruvate kinase
MRVASPALSFLLASAVDAFSPISIGRPSDATKLSAYGIGSWNKSSSGGGGGVAVATPTRNPWDDSNAGQHVEKSYGIDSWTSAPPKMKKSYGLGSWNKAASTTGGADAVAADMLNSSRKASTAAAAQLPSTDNFKSSPRWRKKTKQLATLGPASSTFEMIEKLFLAGADVFRLNFSHGEHAQKKELLDIIRAVEDKYDHPIAILGDLQGPKIRTGTFANPDGEMLQEGQIFRFDSNETPGNNQRVFLPHPEIIEASEIGHELLIDDGKVKVEVVGKGSGYLDCEVVVGGKIKDRKGVNTPDSILEISCLTPKDRADLDYMLSIGVDWVALSFVQRPEDIVEIKRLIMSYNPQNANPPHIMAKIEKPSCFWDDNLERIVELCDGISELHLI